MPRGSETRRGASARRPTATAMKPARFCTLLAVGCLAAALVRDDRRTDGWASGSGSIEVHARLRRGTGLEPPTAEAVRDAIAAAGGEGLAVGFQLLGHRDAAVRAGAALFLGAQRSRLAVPGIVRLLRDPEPSVRCAAADALGAIGDPQALPFLDRAVGEGDPSVADAALRAAHRIRAASERPPRARPPVPVGR